MSEQLIRLYVDAEYSSPYAMSAFVALHEKALPFELCTLDFSARQQHAPSYAAKSLTRRVPTLEHGDFSLSESSAICEYLEEVFPAVALYPQQLQQRARARQVQAWLRSDLMALRNERNTMAVFYGKKFPPLSTAAVAAVEQLVYVADALLGEGAEHLFGQWSIADTEMALMLNRLHLHGDALAPRLVRYAEAQWQRPSVQRWLQYIAARSL
ncbi:MULTISPECIES: glutathione transferase [unclassified Undibacterium]|uniref:glutathione transferase n=1 Tax=unclassified Undibacterium TaxID=2630295 RepID=UPI002AC9366B|nr:MULTISPECIES: glutathione transferase [unclassified Undibacterium]MEB0138705.1 glutathione transferase [Undibacterium sp. CCC2.1]MEB0171506.1 glutathione transferase [Undibacterium sp. CCC1.1]MEB0175423.1 glutathione transferase [Undibacterium sp. CCC3.4]MEB0214706.1 glutathione transferase [Undibacterium sp. 5I2]WPX43335.1 glutathione transferase [Undibacterium sp. CCC3.4]